ncbi:hypothetical protein [Geomicrobium sp. JCM 19038]|uniref:hypothetical protein n=1 Tax=Geomicrobium sp. JCM 19038 TaxID=1460635 RepID=UPI00045F124F|nr:hypothetical protein [Geomicrobium sp. JCM 19038]GAK09602.1 hypothetical protein JCM19038_3444 [Geomicrobium sp. JCM 19038]
MIKKRDLHFYVVNHLNVLGRKEGMKQVGARLGMDREELLRIHEQEQERAV